VIYDPVRQLAFIPAAAMACWRYLVADPAHVAIVGHVQPSRIADRNTRPQSGRLYLMASKPDPAGTLVQAGAEMACSGPYEVLVIAP